METMGGTSSFKIFRSELPQDSRLRIICWTIKSGNGRKVILAPNVFLDVIPASERIAMGSVRSTLSTCY